MTSEWELNIRVVVVATTAAAAFHLLSVDCVEGVSCPSLCFLSCQRSFLSAVNPTNERRLPLPVAQTRLDLTHCASLKQQIMHVNVLRSTVVDVTLHLSTWFGFPETHLSRGHTNRRIASRQVGFLKMISWFRLHFIPLYAHETLAARLPAVTHLAERHTKPPTHMVFSPSTCSRYVPHLHGFPSNDFPSRSLSVIRIASQIRTTSVWLHAYLNLCRPDIIHHSRPFLNGG